MDFRHILGLFVVIGLTFVGFFVYFLFKQIEFVVRSVNLYEKMITRQDVMIKLLGEIRETNGMTTDILMRILEIKKEDLDKNKGMS